MPLAFAGLAAVLKVATAAVSVVTAVALWRLVRKDVLLQVVVRGPMPATVLRSRKARVDRAASDPFTTREVLAELHETPLRGKRQRYGETNRELQAALESEGAEVIEMRPIAGLCQTTRRRCYD